MSKLLQSGWVAMLVGAVLYGTTTVFLLSSAKIAIPRAHASTAPAPAPNETGASWDFFNPEVDLLVKELKREKDALAARQKQLNDLAARLDAERVELSVITQAVARMQQDYDRNNIRVKEEETANLKKLAKTYAGMTPEGAATIFKQMDDDAVVKILLFMKEAESSPVLESFARMGEPEAKRTALITERLRTASGRAPKP